MSGKLQAEIKQRRPFSNIEEELYLNLVRTAEEASRTQAELLKEYDLTGPQYNVLRILRGAGDEGLACGGVSERMVTHDPDVTRLLDRLEKRKLVRRSRESQDRRVITTRITPAGLAILAKLDEPVVERLRGYFKHLGRERQRELIELLEEVRSGAE